MIVCLAPQKIRAEQVDTASINKILETEILPPPYPMDNETTKKRLDSIANSETRNLDQNNKNWNVSSPKWKPVFDRIRADLEWELPNFITALQANPLKMQQDYVADIASHLSQSDVASILAYYSTPEGQRYQDFIRKIDKIMLSGVGVVLAKETAAWPAPEQAKQYGRMLTLSHLAQREMAQVQIAKAEGGDTSGSTAIAILAVAAIKKSPQELEVLNGKYGNDLSGFEAFSGTGAAQHFFAAMEQVWSHYLKTDPFADLIKAVEQKYASEWKALYLAQIGDPHEKQADQ